MFKKIKGCPRAIWEGIKRFFSIQEGEKMRIRIGRLLCAAGLALIIPVIVMMFWSPKDTSYLNKSSDSPKPTGKPEETTPSGGNERLNKLLAGSKTDGRSDGESHQRNGGKHSEVKFSAKQVLVHEGSDPATDMPNGTSFVGKLLTAIDTRDKDEIVRVLLPYGAKFKNEEKLARQSTLFGQVSYPGQGQKVFVKFTSGVNPDGQEFKIQAQALASNDFAPGLVGEFHGNADGRLATSIGLSVLSAGTDTMVDKEALGQGFSITPKASLKNAILAGVSKGAQAEADREAEKINSKEDYVTVESGKELIISLTGTYHGEIRSE